MPLRSPTIYCEHNLIFVINSVNIDIFTITCAWLVPRANISPVKGEGYISYKCSLFISITLFFLHLFFTFSFLLSFFIHPSPSALNPIFLCHFFLTTYIFLTFGLSTLCGPLCIISGPFSISLMTHKLCFRFRHHSYRPIVYPTPPHPLPSGAPGTTVSSSHSLFHPLIGWGENS